ncbi:hypothetical protein KZZ52_08340 [Dactylosporangium sp. AC04546]|uniref:hypothetical protein n=1 Tax=Dactylosporangium sp. AC04546 TaxID=2862460 RepID=UPI001EDE6FFB|nr:hypothetical protein [Dactylosporangium sp. AC04546]WVK85384.1 hypothetical protein KZZ52_08340 [Dactylosporangium sp. AC04546]
MLRTTAALLAALAVTLVAAAPASAAPSAGAGLDAAKRAVADRIDKRLQALDKFTATIGKAKHLDAGHRDTLTKLIADSRSGLTALKTKVTGETTAAAVKADAQSMVNDYRVFMLTGPKVRLSIAIDTELAAVELLRKKPDADQAKLDAVAQSLAGKADALLAIQPGSDGAAIRNAVQPIRAAAKSARTTLKSLR